MLHLITSSIGFYFVLSAFLIGALGSLILSKNDKYANIWSNFFSILGSSTGLIFAISVMITGKTFSFKFNSLYQHLLSFAFNIDMLSAFFIGIISLIAIFCSFFALGYVKHFYKNYNIGALGFFYNILIGSLILVVTSSNAIWFLVAWEMMSISSYFLVVYDRKDESNVKAGLLYLIMTYVGTAFILFAFLLIYKYTNSFDFSIIKSNINLIPLVIKNFIFIFFIVGFGVKAGIIPFHIWLPLAHPAAPSHVSALMSGVMIKTGIYMFIRIFMDILQPIPVWWGITIIIIGSISSLLGVLYALTEHDIKKLLAYHSIENIGIILLGLGSSMIFNSLGMVSLSLLSLMASLFHTLNHAVFKSLLFLSAGSVINEVHTRNMEEYGGIIKYMPQTALFFLIGSMAISALPPFNGFFSEWLTFQSLFQGITQLHSSLSWIFIIAVGSLAFTGGLALTCFVKAFGSIFLAKPRSQEVKSAKESSLSMRIGMGFLALFSILLGLFSGYTTILLEKVGRGLSVFNETFSSISISGNQLFKLNNGFSSIGASSVFIFIILGILFIIFIFKYLVNRDQKIKTGKTWSCGTELTPRMEITSTGFARSIILIFKGVLKPSLQSDIEYHDFQSRYLPKSITITFKVNNVYSNYFYKPIQEIFNGLSMKVKKIQSGNINLYISYIFIILIILLYIIL